MIDSVIVGVPAKPMRGLALPLPSQRSSQILTLVV